MAKPPPSRPTPHYSGYFGTSLPRAERIITHGFQPDAEQNGGTWFFPLSMLHLAEEAGRDEARSLQAKAARDETQTVPEGHYAVLQGIFSEEGGYTVGGVESGGRIFIPASGSIAVAGLRLYSAEAQLSLPSIDEIRQSLRDGYSLTNYC